MDRKDEKYIKGLLLKSFEGQGNFQQFEFACWGMSHRPDFVLLDDTDFTYFEIKSEHDTFARLKKQMRRSVGCFSKAYLVIPEAFLHKVQSLNLGRSFGVYVIEDLERGVLEPRIDKNRGRRLIKIEFVSRVLWSSELKYYVRQSNPKATSVNQRSGKRRTISSMSKYELESFFKLYYSHHDSLQILNEILPKRTWDYRETRESQKKPKEEVSF